MNYSHTNSVHWLESTSVNIIEFILFLWGVCIIFNIEAKPKRTGENGNERTSNKIARRFLSKCRHSWLLRAAAEQKRRPSSPYLCVRDFFFTLFISFCSIPYGSQSHAVPRQVLSQCVWFNKREQLLPKRLCSSYINVKPKGIVRARIWLGAHFGI